METFDVYVVGATEDRRARGSTSSPRRCPRATARRSRICAAGSAAGGSGSRRTSIARPRTRTSRICCRSAGAARSRRRRPRRTSRSRRRSSGPDASRERPPRPPASIRAACPRRSRAMHRGRRPRRARQRGRPFSLASLDGHDDAGAQMPPAVSFCAAARRAAAPRAATSPARRPSRRARASWRSCSTVRSARCRGGGPARRDRRRRARAPGAQAVHVDATTTPASAPTASPPAAPQAPGAAAAPLAAAADHASLRSGRVQPVAIVRAPGRLGVLGDERVRFAAGVLVAILLGFVPAHVIASMRERSAYHAIDAKRRPAPDRRCRGVGRRLRAARQRSAITSSRTSAARTTRSR